MTEIKNSIPYLPKTVTSGKSSEAPETYTEFEEQAAVDTAGFFENLVTGGEKQPEPSTDLSDILGKISAPAQSESQDFSSITVPTVEEVVSSMNGVDPKMTSSATFYDDLQTKYQTTKNDLLAMIDKAKESIKFGKDISGNKAAIKELQKQLVKVETQLAKIPGLKKQSNGILDKEMAVLAQIGKKLSAMKDPTITLDEANQLDINGDGYVGPDKKYAIGKSTDPLTDEVTYTIINAETKAPILHFDATTGMPMDAGTVEANFKYTLSSSGLKMVPAEKKLSDESLVLSFDPTKPLVNSNNHFSSPIDIAVPEYILVQVDDKGDIIKNASGDAEVVPFKEVNGQIIQVPQEGMACKKVYVGKIEMYTEQPNRAPANWKAEDGSDTVVEMYDVDGVMRLASIRIESQPAAAGSKTNSQFVHNGIIAASSLGTTLNGDQRSTPVNIDATAFHSTGRHVISEQDYANLKKKWNITKEDAAFKKNMSLFTEHESRWIAEGSTGANTGLFIAGMKGGIFDMDGAHNLIELDDVSDDYRTGDPLYQSVIAGGNGMNALFAGRGDHYAQQMTVAVINGDKTDINAVTTQYKGYLNKFMDDPSDYIEINTEKGATFVAVNSMDDSKGDDVYKLNTRGKKHFQKDLEGSEFTAEENDKPDGYHPDWGISPDGIVSDLENRRDDIAEGWKKVATDNAGTNIDLEWTIYTNSDYTNQSQAMLDDAFAALGALGLGAQTNESESATEDDNLDTSEIDPASLEDNNE